MPHISKFKLDHKIERELIKTLETVMMKLTKEEEMSEFLSSLMTNTEKLMLAKRLSIVVLLKEGMSDFHISKALNVTRETVLRTRLLMEVRGGGYEHALKKLENEKVTQELKGVLIDLAKYVVRASTGRI